MRSGSSSWLGVTTPFAQLRPRLPGCSGLPSILRTSSCLLVDVGEDAARRLAVEADARNDPVVAPVLLRPARRLVVDVVVPLGRIGMRSEAQLQFGHDCIRAFSRFALAERHALARLDPDVFPREAAGEREERRGDRDGRAAPTDRARRSPRAAATPPPAIAPPQKSGAKAPRRIVCDRELVMARRARREQVLEHEDQRGARAASRRASSRAARASRIADAAASSAASSSAAAPSAPACATRSIVGVRSLPQIARQALREQEAGVARSRARRTTIAGQREQRQHAVQPSQPAQRATAPLSAPCASRNHAPHTIHDRQFGRVRM